VETRSPNDTRTEFALKIAQWLNAGAKVVWALDPADRVLTVHRKGVEPRTLRPEDTLSGDDVLPGFTLSLKRVFRDASTAK
jgi:Uma2 family endonuclease